VEIEPGEDDALILVELLAGLREQRERYYAETYGEAKPG